MEKGRNYPQTGHRWLDPEAVNNWPPRSLALQVEFTYNGILYSGQTSFGIENLDLPNLRLFWDMSLLGAGPNDFDIECRWQVFPLNSLKCDVAVDFVERSSGDLMTTIAIPPFSAINIHWDEPIPLAWPMFRTDTNPHYTFSPIIAPVARLYF